MRDEILADLERALVLHAKRVTVEQVRTLRIYPDGFLITYGDLSQLAEGVVIARAMGPYLTALAEQTKQPLDALVVRKDTGRPGAGYNGGLEFEPRAWERRAHSAIDHLVAKK